MPDDPKYANDPILDDDQEGVPLPLTPDEQDPPDGSEDDPTVDHQAMEEDR